jgi:hypothetical protein
MSIAAARRTRKPELQHDITQDNCKAQKRASNDVTRCAAGVVGGGGVGGFRSTAGSRGISRAGRAGDREGGRNNRRCGGDGNGGSPFFDLVINPGDERSQVGTLHVPGEIEQFNPRDGTGEVLGRGEARALRVNNDGVPGSV